MPIFSSFFIQTSLVLLQFLAINFCHSSLVASVFISSLIVVIGGYLPYIEIISIKMAEHLEVWVTLFY